MSEVKRYHVQLFKLAGDQQKYAHGALGAVEIVRASDYDAAQSELAALREELAAVALNLKFAEEGSLSFAEEADLLQQRLAAAEQRNVAIPTISADQYEGLNDFYLSVCCDSGHRMDKPMVASLCEVGALESCGFGKHRLTKFGEYLLAQAKPTESGASE
jgi:hypothetical protein